MKTFGKAVRIALMLAAGAASAQGLNGAAIAPADAPAPLAFNSGQVLCTAAVNSDGSKASGLHVSATSQLGTSQYEVIFSSSACSKITAANGYARWVQVDTLTAGSITGVSCTTADRSGQPNGVFVNCTNNAGTTVNTSFFLFVAR